MSQQDQYSGVTPKSVIDLFSAKVHHAPDFNETEMDTIANYVKEISDRERGHDSLSDDLRYELELFTAAQSDESFRKILDMRRPLPQTITRQDSVESAVPPPVSHLCNSHITSPAYSFGYPLAEEVGSSVTFLRHPVEAAPSVLAISGLLPSVQDLRTYSQLALPNEGELSLGLGLGKSPAIGGTLIHPASWEATGHPLSPTGFAEVTQARASIGHFFACIPGAPLKQSTEMQVSVDVTVGQVWRPFLLTIPLTIPGSGILYASGTANLVLLDSTGQEAQQRLKFLEYAWFDGGVASPARGLREFSITRGLTLRPGTVWVYIGIEIFLEVSRLFFPPPPPANERTGFVMIDLRSPNHATKAIHPVFGAGGPVRVPRIRLIFCPEQEVVRARHI